ncbi:hypothetical protein SUGI_0548800 [Cryptomeria japonica]|nr:hypothetical protein SUGI_0548800 [Cryptomeria japonica]
MSGRWEEFPYNGRREENCGEVVHRGSHHPQRRVYRLQGRPPIATGPRPHDCGVASPQSARDPLTCVARFSFLLINFIFD